MSTDAASATPQLKTIAQFVKSFHFTNDAATNNTQVRTAPKIDIQVEISNKPAPDNRHLVSLELTVEANANDDAVFTVEVEYAGVFEISGVPEEKLPVVLQVECPRLIFPFVRRLIADATREGGFMPLLLDPIDFLGIYMKRRAAAAGEGAAPGPNGKASDDAN